jgi:hypothetical protein
MDKKLKILQAPNFNVNDLVYSKLEAQKGVLYRVVIKKIILHPDNMSDGAFQFYTYEDTLHDVHLEENIVSYDDAVDIINSL